MSIMTAILATQEVETRGSPVQGWPEQLRRPISKEKVKGLETKLCGRAPLGSVPRTTNKNGDAPKLSQKVTFFFLVISG